MTDYNSKIARLKKQLQQVEQKKRTAEAKQRAKEQRELDRRNMLLGRALAQTGEGSYFQTLRGVLGQRKSELRDLSEKDYQNLMTYFDQLIRRKE